MNIHNYYSDVLLSIRTLFDNFIFNSNFIKYYSFNIANKTFELSQRDYKPNRELPSVIVNLESERYTFGERPTNIIRSSLENINQIPVLYDFETKRTIFIQEEHIVIPLLINFNCESQFQAKEVEYHIKRFLPLDKYIQLYEFTSFLEIDSSFLLKLGFDFNKRSIVNLFTRLNKNLGISEYCFSLSYRPLLHLMSINTNISSPEQSTYTVNMSLDLSIQAPLHILYDTPSNKIESINVDFTRFGHEPIAYDSMKSYIQQNDDIRLNSPKKIIRRNLLVHDFTDFNLMELEVKGVNYKLFEISFDTDDFILKDNMEFNFFDVDKKFHNNIKPTLIDKDINTIKFQITEEDYNNYFNADLTNPVVIQFVEVQL
jgi:hypothetical protein